MMRRMRSPWVNNQGKSLLPHSFQYPSILNLVSMIHQSFNARSCKSIHSTGWKPAPLEKRKEWLLLILPGWILKDKGHAGMIGQDQLVIFKGVLCRKLQRICKRFLFCDVPALPFGQIQISKPKQAAFWKYSAAYGIASAVPLKRIAPRVYIQVGQCVIELTGSDGICGHWVEHPLSFKPRISYICLLYTSRTWMSRETHLY